MSKVNVITLHQLRIDGKSIQAGTRISIEKSLADTLLRHSDPAIELVNDASAVEVGAESADLSHAIDVQSSTPAAPSAEDEAKAAKAAEAKAAKAAAAAEAKAAKAAAAAPKAVAPNAADNGADDGLA